MKPVVTFRFSCGRAFLMVNGDAIVMEGDYIRDPDLQMKEIELYEAKYKNGPHWESMKVYGNGKVWSEDLIKYVVRKANNGELPE